MVWVLSLMRVAGVGVAKSKALIDYFGSAEAVWKERPDVLRRLPGMKDEIVSQMSKRDLVEKAKEEVEWMEKKKVRMIFYKEKDYPFRLAECPDCPIALFYLGKANLNAKRILSVVGTRRASEYGKSNTKKLVSEMARLFNEPPTIVSGLALGIDAVSHRSALDCGMPTIAVLGHGLSTIYPRYNRSLAIEMLEKGGGLLTEFQHDVSVNAPNFPQRDRIIAGMSDGVFVGESAIKGGALITASYAVGYGRDVFAMPGRVSDVLSEGCNMLIRNNRAALVMSGSDIAKGMNWQIEREEEKGIVVDTNLFGELSQSERVIAKEMRKNPDGWSLNELSRALDMPMSDLVSTLVQMEFKHYVKCLPGNIYKLEIG